MNDNTPIENNEPNAVGPPDRTESKSVADERFLLQCLMDHIPDSIYFKDAAKGGLSKSIAPRHRGRGWNLPMTRSARVILISFEPSTPRKRLPTNRRSCVPANHFWNQKNTLSGPADWRDGCQRPNCD